MKSYKKYRKDISNIIKNNKYSLENTLEEMLTYYSKNIIKKEDLTKRYKNLCCYEKNFSPFLVGIISGIISSLFCSLIISANTLDIIILLIILFGVTIILVYNNIIKYTFADNYEIYINPYEKILIEKKLEQDYKFNSNNFNIVLKQTIKNKASNKGIQANTYNEKTEQQIDEMTSELIQQFKNLSLKDKGEIIKIICEMSEKK